MGVQWIQAIIDLPANGFGQGAEFWLAVSGSRFGDIHPDHDEFVHLVPPSGDMHLELQRIDQGPPGVHLDLLVDDIAAEVARAVGLGAQLIAQPGHAVLQSPAGARFCIVPYSGEADRAAALASPAPHRIDQICIDVPASDFERDIEFWSAVTGWPVRPRSPDEFKEFETLERPSSMAVGLLIQQLGPDDGGHARTHLDISCGPNVNAVVEAHVALGASVTDRRERWTVMSDPVGMVYCLTRSPMIA